MKYLDAIEENKYKIDFINKVIEKRVYGCRCLMRPVNMTVLQVDPSRGGEVFAIIGHLQICSPEPGGGHVDYMLCIQQRADGRTQDAFWVTYPSAAKRTGGRMTGEEATMPNMVLEEMFPGVFDDNTMWPYRKWLAQYLHM